MKWVRIGLPTYLLVSMSMHVCMLSCFSSVQHNEGRRQWHPNPALLPGKSHGWRSLVGCSPWGLWGSDMTEQLHFRFSLSCTGEGNGNPLQCSCLENPWDEGAWWAAAYAVTQSRTRLKWLSNSSRRRWVIEDLALIYVIECSAYVFILSGLTFRSLIHLSLYLCMVLESVLISFFYM